MIFVNFKVDKKFKKLVSPKKNYSLKSASTSLAMIKEYADDNEIDGVVEFLIFEDENLLFRDNYSTSENVSSNLIYLVNKSLEIHFKDTPKQDKDILLEKLSFAMNDDIEEVEINKNSSFQMLKGAIFKEKKSGEQPTLDQSEKIKLEEERKNQEEQLRLEQERKNQEELLRLEQERKEQEEQLRLEQERKEQEEQLRLEQERKEQVEQLKLEQERKEQEKQLRLEQERKEQEEQVRFEQERKAQEEQLRLEQERKEQVEQLELEQERKEQEEQLRLEQEKKAQEEQLRIAQERKQLEEHSRLMSQSPNSINIKQEIINEIKNDKGFKKVSKVNKINSFFSQYARLGNYIYKFILNILFLIIVLLITYFIYEHTSISNGELPSWAITLKEKFIAIKNIIIGS